MISTKFKILPKCKKTKLTGVIGIVLNYRNIRDGCLFSKFSLQNPA